MALIIGYAQQDFTPSLDQPVFLAGFGQNRRSESIHEPLSSRVMALMTSSHRIALVSCDPLGLGRCFCQSIEPLAESFLMKALIPILQA